LMGKRLLNIITIMRYFLALILLAFTACSAPKFTATVDLDRMEYRIVNQRTGRVKIVPMSTRPNKQFMFNEIQSDEK